VTPLSDLGSAEYLGFAGGLYPKGKNSPPSAYENSGVQLAASVQPRDKYGKRSPSGKIVMVCIGMSNASSEFSQFIRLTETDARKNPSLFLIDAGRNAANAIEMAAPLSDYWRHVDRRLERNEISAAQIQVVWLKTALAHEPGGFPEKARLLQGALRSIIQILSTKFQELKLLYVSSRTYGGYSETDLSPEPIAYESGFAVKWLIEEHINNPNADTSVPWVTWGPYLWADGPNPRGDGLVWERSDFEPDGVHPSAQGALKVATKLLEFFQSNPTSRHWFFSQAS
jgi:hypothetical protein